MCVCFNIDLLSSKESEGKQSTVDVSSTESKLITVMYNYVCLSRVRVETKVAVNKETK